MNSLSIAQPLYLQNSSVTRLDLDASMRLRIERKALPEKRIPLHHISRIVCSSSLDISTRTLIACMKSGVPLMVMDQTGETLGWCLGARRKETSLRQLLSLALDDSVWNARYTKWLQQQRAAYASEALLMCGVRISPAARRNPKVALCNAHYRKHGQATGIFVNALANLAQHELAAVLAKEVSEPSLLTWHRPGLNLIDDLGSTMGLFAHIDLHHTTNLPEPDQLTAWAVRHYEKHAPHWQQRLGQVLFDFERFLRAHWL